MGRIHPECPLEIDSFKFVISFAVICGLLWIAAAVASFLAHLNSKKELVLVSACPYSIGYIIFVGLFGAIMAQISAQNSCLKGDPPCEKVKMKLRSSGNEFMGYSISAFVLITPSIIFTFYSALFLEPLNFTSRKTPASDSRP